jgi:hypothetical protein
MLQIGQSWNFHRRSTRSTSHCLILLTIARQTCRGLISVNDGSFDETVSDLCYESLLEANSEGIDIFQYRFATKILYSMFFDRIRSVLKGDRIARPSNLTLTLKIRANDDRLLTQLVSE